MTRIVTINPDSNTAIEKDSPIKVDLNIVNWFDACEHNKQYSTFQICRIPSTHSGIVYAVGQGHGYNCESGITVDVYSPEHFAKKFELIDGWQPVLDYDCRKLEKPVEKTQTYIRIN